MLNHCPSVRTVAITLSLACVLFLPASPTPAADIITPGAALVEVHSAAKFFEGPSWDPLTQKLYFSSLTAPSELLSLTPPSTVTQWMPDSQGINGTFRSRAGRLLCAQGDTRSILSLGLGAATPQDPLVLAQNLSWNAPNDICQTPSGDIYFTTPDFATRSTSVVYHLSTSGTVTPVVTEMTLCNGVIASLDGSTLYVSDSYDKLWRSYPILPDGTVGTGSVFFNPSTSNTADPDGMTIDEFGNLYLNGRGGLWIVSPAGQQLEMVPVFEFNTNATFGGSDGRTLYITCDRKLYSLAMEVRGALWQGVPENNQPPNVNAGQDHDITIRVGYTLLDATVTDDNIPDPPAGVTTNWSKVTGPGNVTFDNSAEIDTVATFSAVGDYVLRLWAFDGLLPATDDVSIRVLRPGDFNGDGDVDSEDANRFGDCMTGAGIGPPAPDCQLLDIDLDDDVDMNDFGLFQRCLSGQGVPGDPTCAD